MDSEELKRNLTSGRHWLRLLFMVLFVLVLYVASVVMAVVVVLQFLFSLITGQDNLNLRRFGHSLAQYIYQTLCFLTYNREDKPFPFDDWPSEEENTVAAPVAKPRPRASRAKSAVAKTAPAERSEEHTSELQSRGHLVCRLLLEKKKKKHTARGTEHEPT